MAFVLLSLCITNQCLWSSENKKNGLWDHWGRHVSRRVYGTAAREAVIASLAGRSPTEIAEALEIS